MKKIRIGNDIKISWSITNKKDGSPYNLEGKNLKLYFGTYGVNEDQIEFTVSGNVISWTFYGKDQKKPGDYHLTLVENQGDKGMVTVDACNPFGLVPTSCMVGGESSCGNVSIETVEIQSEIDVQQIATGGTVKWDEIEGKPENFADWNAEEGDEKFIANKPVIPSKTSELENDSEFVTKGDIPDTSTFITKTYADESYQPKGDYLTEESDPTVPSWAKEPNKPAYTSEEVGAIAKGGLKTVNGQSLEGEGNIEIQGGGGGISDAPTDGSKYVRQNGNWVKETEVDTSTLATKEELSTKLDSDTYNTEKESFATKEELSSKADKSQLTEYLKSTDAESTYAKKEDVPESYTLPTATAETLGGVKVGAGLSINPETGVLSATGGGTADSVDWANITSKPDFKTVATTGSYNDLTDKPSIPSKTSEITNDSGFLTTVPEEYVTETELEGKGYATQTDLEGKQDKGDYALKSEIPDISPLATKQEVTDGLSSKVDVSAISDMETKTNAAATYQPKGDYATKDELSGYVQTATAEETYAKKADIPSSMSQLQNDVKFITYTDYVSQ